MGIEVVININDFIIASVQLGRNFSSDVGQDFVIRSRSGHPDHFRPPHSFIFLTHLASCFVLQRLEAIMLELKSSNNSEVLRQIGGYSGSTNNYRESRCNRCIMKE